ncbi:unnamed protein product [Prorocentrum cordatum]|uniref:Uncharacterized protein n=1 Tax=Prorocentrum cordatum TaxID=2364126 RepID=A0ABN9SPT4_9DINO|nr:unnamed protein product [Polarella glacialis]
MDVRAMARRCTRRCTLPIRLARQADRFTQDMDDITTGVGPCADVECRDGPSLLTCTDVLALPPGGARGPWGPAPPGEGAGARDLRDAPAAGLPRAPRPRRLPSHRAAAAGRRRRGRGSPGRGRLAAAIAAAPAVDCSAAARARCSAPSRRRPRRRAISCELSACLASLGRVHCFSARAIEEHL